MRTFDLHQLEADKANGKYANVGAICTFINNINKMYKTMAGNLQDCQIYYRGHADNTFQEVPSVYRNDNQGNPWAAREDDLCDEIMRECPSDFRDNGTVFDKLVKMQHYELPTRLLDITENPLVALYFACLPVQGSKNDGQIIVYFIPKEDIRNHSDQSVAALSCLSFISNDAFSKVKTDINHLLEEMRAHTTNLPKIADEKDFDKTVCVRARKSNPRIIRQHGAFFLFGAKDGDKQNISDFPFQSFKMEVSNSQKKQILRELERYGISEKSLFPEIDKVAHHIRTH